MTYLNGLRASGIDPLLVSGGDFLFAMKDYKERGNRYYRQQMVAKAQLIAHAYNTFGYQAAAVGEQDLVFGLDVVRDLQPRMNFPMLCCNLANEDGTLLFTPSTIVQKGEYKVGIIGAILETLSPSFLQNTVPGAKVLPPVEAIRAEAQKLREQVDVVFVLGHINRKNVDRLAQEVPEIDFVLEPNSYNGNASIWVNQGQYFVEKNGKVFVRMDGQGAHIGRLDIKLRGRGLPWSTSLEEKDKNVYHGQDIALGPHWGVHAGMEKLVKQYRLNTKKFTPTELDSTFQASKDYLTIDTCKACHPNQYEFWTHTGHAKAYATLEKSDDQFRYDCLPCHVVGFGETFVNAHEVGQYKNVQCESCHGTNPQHPTNPTLYKWPKVDDKKCWGCHNPMETKAPFDPKTAIPKVACPKLDRG